MTVSLTHPTRRLLDESTGIRYVPIVPSIPWQDAVIGIAGHLTFHGLHGTVSGIDSPHPCDVRLHTTPFYARQIAPLLRSVLNAGQYTVVGPEIDTVTVQIRTPRHDVMGGSGLVHREDAERMSPDDQARMVSRRIESPA